MRIFALSTRPLWHGVCFPARLHGTRSNHVRRTHRRRHHADLPPSGPCTTIDCPTLIIVHKTLGSRAQPSPNFARPATSAGNQTHGREATSSLIDFTARKDYVRTRMRREPIAHWTKASSRRCLVIHSRPQKFRDNGIRKQADLLSNYAGHHRRLLPKRTQPKKIYDRVIADIVVDGYSERRCSTEKGTRSVRPIAVCSRTSA